MSKHETHKTSAEGKRQTMERKQIRAAKFAFTSKTASNGARA